MLRTSVAVDDTLLEEMLAADNWPFERLDDNTWRSGFRTEKEQFRFFVRLTENWVYLTIIPFVTLPDEESRLLEVFRRLLELNREITLAKFAIDKRDVVLTVELPTESLQPSQFKDGLDALSFYANKHHAELVELSTLLS